MSPRAIHPRPPTPALIEALESRGCSARDWKEVLLHPQCDPECFRDALFEGPVTVGRMDARARLSFPGLPSRSPGLFRVRLAHVHLGDDVRLEAIGETVRHVRIGDGSMVLRTEELSCDLQSSFGVGDAVAVLNENGGRRCLLHDGLSLQWAWLQAFCKHDPALQTALAKSTSRRAQALRGQPSVIGNDVLIRACGILRNLRVGNGARIVGAPHLEDGWLHAQTKIDGPATAKHFIMAPRASLEGASRLEHAFLGEGSEVGKGAIVEHSLFFANTQFHAGEAASAWAGPHAISHHKATLLLAGAFQFFNAGSATNFSNHHYRLGPVHQGILDRGCKTGSGSLLLFPARVGAFSTIVGRHGRPFSSEDFPFSLLVGKEERTLLYPGLLCFSAGQSRDEMKWPKRDLRGPHSSDHYSATRLSPLTASRSLRGLERLRLAMVPGNTSEMAELAGLRVPRKHLATGVEQYETLLKFYVFQGVLRRAASAGEPLPWPLFPAKPGALEEWVDWAGIPCPRRELDRVIGEVRRGRLREPAEVARRAARVLASQGALEWGWIRRAAPAILDPESLGSPERFKSDMRKTLSDAFDRILIDGAKEFQPSARIGYGLGGKVDGDFDSVRGRQRSEPTLVALASARKAALLAAGKLRFSMGAGSSRKKPLASKRRNA
jgi:acetyltransferase-like isoleucine patch superfamily enzyme